jgi:hypothetical protein
MKPAWRRSEEQRKEQLEQMQRQIEAGTLVVRQMTAEERAKLRPSKRVKKSVRKA